MSQIDEKIKQCETDIESLRRNLEELKSQRGSPDCVVATGKYYYSDSDSNDRVILNLSKLSTSAKITLRDCIRKNYSWISFKKNGELGGYSSNLLNEWGIAYTNITKVF